MALTMAPPPLRESRPPALPAQTTERVAAPAGFWIRACAHLIDSMLFSMITLPLLIGVYWDDMIAHFREAARNAMLGASSSGSMALFHGPAGLIIQYVIPSIAIILLWRWRSATPGKMLLRLEIVDVATMGKPSTGKLLVRFFGYIVSMIPFCLGFLWVGWDPRKQGWHDKMAGTTVVQRLR